MKHLTVSLVLTCSLLSLAGCSDKPPAPHAPAAPWDGAKHDEQRAHDVQKMVDQQHAHQQAQERAQEH